jgi:SPT2 chromatin protein
MAMACGGGDDKAISLYPRGGVQVTRGFYREDRRGDAGDDRAMVASAAEMRAEEARSRRIGRQEDAEAEREELRRLAAKEAKLARARKRRKAARRKDGSSGGKRGDAAMFLDDGGDDEDDDDESLELSD